MAKEDIQISTKTLEEVLTGSLSPVQPRSEFIGDLKHKLEDRIYPLQKKATIGLNEFLNIVFTILAVFFIGVLVIRAVFILISTLDMARKTTKHLKET